MGAPSAGRPAVLPRAVWVPWLTTRAALLVAGWVGLRFFPTNQSHWQWQAFPDQPWIDAWARWDAGWYWSVVERGYSYVPDGQCNVAFFPFFPLASAALSLPLRPWLEPRQAFLLAGIALSHAAFLAACLGVYRLGETEFGARAAARSVWLLCTFPFAVFFSAAYTESLYLALAVWSFLLARRRRWWRACGLAALCSLTRVPGLLVGIALAVEYLRPAGRFPHAVRRDALALALPFLAYLALLGYFQLEFGDPFVFAKVQTAWGRTGPGVLVDQVASVVTATGSTARVVRFAWSIVFFLAALPHAAVIRRRLPAAEAVFTIGSLLLAIGTGLMSTGRFLAVVFPLFLAAGVAVDRRDRLVPLCALFAAFQGLFAYYFANWYPML